MTASRLDILTRINDVDPDDSHDWPDVLDFMVDAGLVVDIPEPSDPEAERDALRAENERHRKANLVRAVTKGLDPEWVSDIIRAEGFDAVPWKITNSLLARNRALWDFVRAYDNQEGTGEDPYDRRALDAARAALGEVPDE